MSRSRELRDKPENNLNFFNMLSAFSPKPKYRDMLMRIFTKTPNIPEFVTQIKDNFVKELGIPKENFDKLNDNEVILLECLVSTYLTMDSLKTYVKFCEYNERKLVKNNDLQKYTKFKEMFLENQKIELTLKDKDLEKERLVIFKDDEWISLLPLTYESSKKYGANTKWCTASAQTSDQFYSYTNRGCLIYNINTVTGEKVAVYKDINEKNSSFWNAKDDRIDSIECGLDGKVLSFLKKYLKDPALRPNSKLINTKPALKVKTNDQMNGDGVSILTMMNDWAGLENQVMTNNGVDLTALELQRILVNNENNEDVVRTAHNVNIDMDYISEMLHNISYTSLVPNIGIDFITEDDTEGELDYDDEEDYDFDEDIDGYEPFDL